MPRPIQHLTLGSLSDGLSHARIYRNTANRGDPSWNSHDYFEIALCVAGKGRYKTLSRKHAFRKGTVLITNAGEIHCFDLEERLEIYYFQFDETFLRNLSEFVPETASRNFFLEGFLAGRKGGCLSLSLPPAKAVEMKIMFDSLIREVSERPSGFHTMVRVKWVEMIIQLSRIQDSDSRTRDVKVGSEMVLDRALVYLQENFREELNLSNLASITGFSADYFSKIFKKRTSYHVREYINELRIREACRLLRSGGENISEIAWRCGFEQIPHFNRVFKKLVGRSPKVFQRCPSVEESGHVADSSVQPRLKPSPQYGKKEA